MLSLTPPSKPEHTFDYSNVDLETRYTPPFAGDSVRATARTYTLDKEAWKILRPDSLNITLEYGGQGSLVGVPKKIYFDRGHITNLSDTLKGQQIGIVSAEGDTLKFVYDGSLVNQVSWSGTNGVNTVKGKVAFRYNSDQQVIAESVIPVAGSADSVNLQYDQDGLLTSIGLMKLKYGTSNTLLLSDTIRQTDGGQVGSIVTNYGYDTFGALSFKESKYGATTLYRVDYVRDSLSRIIEKTEIDQSNTVTYGYTYDVTGRLNQVWRNDTLISVYSYDANGNRLAHWTPDRLDSGSYDTQDRLLKYSASKYTYTKNGDRTMKVDTVTNDTTRYSYDTFGNLRSVTLFNGTIIEYIIDGANRRIGKKVNGKMIQKWLYDDDLKISAELDSVNNITARFIYGTKVNVPEYIVKNDTIFRVIVDQLGSVRKIIDNYGNIIESIEYDEFGCVVFDSNPGYVPFGYAGGLYEQMTGLVKFGVRDYDAKAGKWITKDPEVFNGGDVNIYTYVGNDPINRIDPTGQFLYPWEDAIDVVGGTYEQQQMVKASFQRIFRTSRGKELEEMIRGPWYRHGNPVTVIINNAGRTEAECPGNKIWYDPSLQLDIQTSWGIIIAFIDQILGHELGHTQTGTGDTGPGNMDNTRQNENPIEIQLGWPARRQY